LPVRAVRDFYTPESLKGRYDWQSPAKPELDDDKKKTKKRTK
jgi:hypothetical protein